MLTGSERGDVHNGHTDMIDTTITTFTVEVLLHIEQTHFLAPETSFPFLF